MIHSNFAVADGMLSHIGIAACAWAVAASGGGRSAEPAEPAVLVRAGRGVSTIVVPGDASRSVRFAASELQRYVKEMSGAVLPIVAEGTAGEVAAVEGPTIHVGLTTRAREALPAEVRSRSEGIFIRIAPKLTIMCGGGDRGTIFAVYRFLERFLGCRWPAPDVDIVPRKATIRLRPADLASVPAFDLRLFIAQRGNREVARSRMLWGLKMGMNGFYREDAAEKNGGCWFLPPELPSCHTYARVIPNDPYFKTHPEWFPLIDGERVPTDIHGRQLCVTAPGLADEFARRIDEILTRHPNCRITSISPNDGYGWCECPACTALDKKLCGGRTTKQGLASERPFRGDRVFWFANEVARRVARKHPGVLLLELAYINYAEPPDTIRPASNVVPWLCHYAPADYSRPIADPSSEANKQFNVLLRRWAAISPNLLFYSYVSKSMWWRLPRPVMHNFAEDIRYLHALGIHRYYCQSSLSDWALDGPLYYVIAKLLWDPGADPDAAAAEWAAAMFGPAAGPMLKFYAAVERSVRNTGQSYSDNPPRQVPGLYDSGELDRAMARLEEAEKAATKDDQALEHVRAVARGFRYGYHMIRCIEAAHRFREEPTRALMHEALEEGRRALSYCRVREAAKFVENLRMHDELGVLARGFGEAETLGGRRCWNTDETGPGDGKAGWAVIYIETPDTSRPVMVEMDAWGKSDLQSIVVNTGGRGLSYAQGGVWTPVRPEKPLSGKARWETVAFTIPPDALARGKRVQTIGMGGGDSQIWIAAVRVRGGPVVMKGDDRKGEKKQNDASGKDDK